MTTGGTYRLGVLGATGRMGRCVAAVAQDGFLVNGRGFEIVDAVAVEHPPVEIGGVYTRRAHDPPTARAAVWIDFSVPTATLALLGTIAAPIVIATTGFSADELQIIHAYSSTNPVVQTSNTSIGMNVMMDILRRLPAGLPFDVTLHEAHHRRKMDAPSGTAKSLVQLLAAQGYRDIPVHSVRAGGIRGVHTVQLAAEDEIIEIRHEALDRRIFAEGALRAAAFLSQVKKPGMYAMQDVIQPPQQ